jgi:hypothetical protein
VGLGVVQLPPDALGFPAAGGRQPQQRHLAGGQDLVLERVSLPLLGLVLVEREAVNLDCEQRLVW